MDTIVPEEGRAVEKTPRLPRLSAKDLADVAEIMRLHDEAFEHYIEQGDGHHKSSEGLVELSLGNYWERGDHRPVAVGIYSYVLGPNRMHYFDTIAEGLAAMREWHKAEMEFDYSEGGDA